MYCEGVNADIRRFHDVSRQLGSVIDCQCFESFHGEVIVRLLLSSQGSRVVPRFCESTGLHISRCQFVPNFATQVNGVWTFA